VRERGGETGRERERERARVRARVPCLGGHSGDPSLLSFRKYLVTWPLQEIKDFKRNDPKLKGI